MSMMNTGDILETIEMFTQDNLDVRTVTMGISLLDCIDTDMIANLSPEDKAELADSTSLCRMGMAEDVADAITLLASERARFVTGQVFGVDGGLLI